MTQFDGLRQKHFQAFFYRNTVLPKRQQKTATAGINIPAAAVLEIMYKFNDYKKSRQRTHVRPYGPIGISLRHSRLLHPFQAAGHRRDGDNDNGDHGFHDKIAVVVNDRVKHFQRLREVFRHVIHPVKVSAKGVESAPEHNGQDIAFKKAIFAFCKKIRQRQGLQRQGYNRSIPGKR